MSLKESVQKCKMQRFTRNKLNSHGYRYRCIVSERIFPTQLIDLIIKHPFYLILQFKIE